MEVVIYDILLDTQYAGCRRQIELKKGEANSKTFRIELCKGTEPIAIDPKETIAIIKGYKEDGTVIFNSAKITDESKIEYEVGSQDTAAVGTTWYEVQLVAKDGYSYKILYSAQFKAVVKDTVVEDGKITSSDEFGLLVETITENKTWKENKDKELDEWMKAREKDIAEKEQEHETLISQYEKEHVDLIYDNTLVYSSTKTFTSSDGRSEPGKAFVSNEMEVDCDAIEVTNNSTTMCKVMRDSYNVLGTVGPNQTKRIILKDIPKYHIEINSVIPGETSVDPTKIKINKYISVKAWKENKDSELDEWMKAREKDIAAKEQEHETLISQYEKEHVDLIYDNTLVYSSTKTFTSSDGRSEPGKAFVSNEMEVDCDAIEVTNNSTTMCKVMRDSYNVLGTVGPNQTKRIILKDIPKYHIEINSVIPGETSVDPTKIKINKYISVKRANLALSKNESFVETMAETLTENVSFVSKMAPVLPENETFVSKMAEVLPSTGTFISDIAKKLPSDTTFISNMGSKIASVLPSTGAFVSDVGKKLMSDSTFISGIAGSSYFASKLVENSTFMTSAANKMASKFSTSALEILASSLASPLTSNTIFMNNIAKIASNSTFISTVTTDPLFMRGVANNFPSHMTSVTRSYLASYIEEPLATNASFMANMASLLPANGTFIENIAKVGSNNTFVNTLLAGTSFINGVAEKMPSRLGFFGVYQTITTPNESGKEYFKFADYSIKGKYSINSDRNKINIPRKLLSIKVRGNFSGAQSCKNCKICGEVIDENNQIVLSNFEIFRVKAGSDANGLVTGTQPFNAEYILNADLDDSSLGNKTLYIRFYVKYDTMAYFYNIGSWGDCSVTITEI